MKFILIFLFSVPALAQKATIDGRFKLIQLSEMRRDQYLLDSQTGRLWNKVCAKTDEKGDCEAHMWQEELVETTTTKHRK